MKPFFSIVIPTLNEELFLPDLLNDLQKQKSKNFEIFVIDSKSVDKTKSIIQNWKGMTIRFYDNEKRNVSSQRNLGAQKSTGKYLVFLDADSRVGVYFTKKLEKEIAKNQGLFFVPAVKSDDASSDTEFLVDVVNFFVGISQNIGRPFAFGGAMIIERQYFYTIGGFDENITLAEDFDIAKRSYEWGVRAKYLEDIYVTYSLRRIRREGKLKTYYKYLITNSQYLIKGKVDGNSIKYEMGGHMYGKAIKSNDMNKKIKQYMSKIKRTFNRLLSED